MYKNNWRSTICILWLVRSSGSKAGWWSPKKPKIKIPLIPMSVLSRNISNTQPKIKKIPKFHNTFSDSSSLSNKHPLLHIHYVQSNGHHVTWFYTKKKKKLFPFTFALLFFMFDMGSFLVYWIEESIKTCRPFSLKMKEEGKKSW